MGSTIVWITGASSGIGRALADTLPWDDARVINVSRRPVDGRDNVLADLSTPEGWARVAESFERELSEFDGARAVLVHAAGTLTPIGFAGEVEPDALARCVLLDSASPQIVGDAFLRALRRTTARGHLAIISSGAATSVYAGWAAYGAGKAAVDQWVRTVGAEQALRGDRCQVIAIAPGVVATPMQDEIRETSADQFPKVQRFVELFEGDRLRSPSDAARDIWRLVTQNTTNGAVVDVRDA